MAILPEEFIFSAFQLEAAGTKFPIDFDFVTEKLGYSRKSNAKRLLVAELIEGEDYILINNSSMSNQLTTRVFTVQEKGAQSRREEIKLSCDGYDHFAMMAQTPEGRQARREFIAYKKAYLASLERSLESSAHLLEIQDKAAKYDELIQQCDTTTFSKTLKAVWQVSGIRQYRHIENMLKENFAENVDYISKNGEYILNNATFMSIVAACRSTDGIDTEKLPTPGVILWSNYARLTKKLRNTWMPKPRSITVNIQLTLFKD